MADAVPVVGTVKGLYEIGMGKDPLTGKQLSNGERWFAAGATAAGMIPFGKLGARALGKWVFKNADEAAEVVVKQADNVGGSSAKITAEKVAAQVDDASNTVDKSWKLKIDGKVQKTGTPGHQFRTYREAITEAKNPDVSAVHLDHGYNRALGLDPKTISPNLRPVVLSIYNDGTVKRIEVQSRTDVPAVLRSRNSELDQQLKDQGFTPTPPVVVRPN